MKINEEIQLLKTDTDQKFNYAIIFLIVALFIYCYFGTFSFFERYINIQDQEYWKIIYHNFSAFTIFFVLGIIYTKFIMKTSPKDFGLKLGNKKLGGMIILLSTIIIPLLALSTLLDNDMTSTYPLVNFETYSSWWQIGLYFVSYLAYYIGWEYMFRGIAIHSTKDKSSALGAILLTTLISSLIHTSIAGLGKPMIETLSAIPAGLIFGWISYKTDSIYYSLYAHTLIGFLTDIFIFFII